MKKYEDAVKNNKPRVSTSRILLSGLFVIALILAACSGSGIITTTTTETLEEIS